MKIVAIGGGSVEEGETLRMDRELIHLSGKERPKLLFIPTASDDSLEYVECVYKTYQALGCETETLFLLGTDASPTIAKTKIEWADIVYVGGGNTKKLIACWRELGVDEMLRKHLEAGKPAGGVSAGAICWFAVGNSDWPQYEGIPDLNTAPLDALGFVDLVLCPHTKCESFRLSEFRAMMKDIPGTGIGVDDCCALQIEGDSYRIIASQPDSVAHRIEWKDGVLNERILPPHDDFQSLDELRRG